MGCLFEAVPMECLKFVLFLKINNNKIQWVPTLVGPHLPVVRDQVVPILNLQQIDQKVGTDMNY